MPLATLEEIEMSASAAYALILEPRIACASPADFGAREE
jgi:hypothetical protein